MNTKKKYEKKQFMKVYTDLFDTELSTNAVLLLSYLIDVEPILKKVDSDGYRRIANSFITERLSWSQHTIKKTFDELVEFEFISLKETRGSDIKGTSYTNKQRWYKINQKNLDKVLINEYIYDDNTANTSNISGSRWY